MLLVEVNLYIYNTITADSAILSSLMIAIFSFLNCMIDTIYCMIDTI